MAALIALLFTEAVVVFSLFVLGFTTHFALDLLLGHVSGGMLHTFRLLTQWTAKPSNRKNLH